MAEFFRKKKKVCPMCTHKDIKYSDAETIKRYISNSGKILPRRATGACAKHQRYIAGEVIKARFMGIIPFVK